MDQRSIFTFTETQEVAGSSFGFSFLSRNIAMEVLNNGQLLSLCIKTQRSETNWLYLFFLHCIHALLICQFM